MLILRGCTFFAFSVLLVSSALAEREPKPAPPLLAGKVSEKQDLGQWDDAFWMRDQGTVIARRGADLFDVAPSGERQAKIRSTVTVDASHIFGTFKAGRRFWVFFNSPNTTAFGLDLYGGTVAEFVVPSGTGEEKVDRKNQPHIGSHLVLPHINAAVFSLGGGSDWPRDGNRPVYFRLDLLTGKVMRFPIGWDLSHFSQDQRVAVFSEVSKEMFAPPHWHAIDLQTGEKTDKQPDRSTELFVSYLWNETDPVQPLYARRASEGDAEFFAGLTYRGLAMPIRIDLEGAQYLAEAKFRNHYAGFRLRRSGSSRHEPSPYWIMPELTPDKAERLAARVSDFALTNRGGIYVVAGEPKKSQPEPWYYGDDGKTLWQVFEKLERLPPLEPRFADKDWAADTLRVRLIESSGGGPNSLVLCHGQHTRHDMRARIGGEADVVPPANWQTSILVDVRGKRSEFPEIFGRNLPDLIWLHDSGWLVTGVYSWQGEVNNRIRKVQLHSQQLRME